MNEELSIVVQKYDVNRAIAQPIIDAFMPHYTKVLALTAEASALIAADLTMAAKSKLAGEMRRDIKGERCGSDAVRKKQKENYLRIGNAIQGVHNTIAGIAEPMEAKLLEIEEFAEREEAARKMALGRSRYDQLIPFGVPPYLYALDEISEAEFQEVLVKEVAGRDAKLKAEAEAKAVAAKAEAARIAESRRISMENARLRKEREEAEAVAKKEREAHAAELAKKQKELDAERLASEKVAQDIANAKLAAQMIEFQRKEREEVAARAAEKARRKAESAPDAEKLAAYAAALASVPQPTLASEDGRTCLETIRTNVADMIAWIHEEAKKL